MSPTPEPCAWCGWVRGEHASACALNAYLLELAANLEFPPGRNETPMPREPQPRVTPGPAPALMADLDSFE